MLLLALVYRFYSVQIREMFAKKELVMGFGHRVYKYVPHMCTKRAHFFLEGKETHVIISSKVGQRSSVKRKAETLLFLLFLNV